MSWTYNASSNAGMSAGDAGDSDFYGMYRSGEMHDYQPNYSRSGATQQHAGPIDHTQEWTLPHDDFTSDQDVMQTSHHQQPYRSQQLRRPSDGGHYYAQSGVQPSANYDGGYFLKQQGTPFQRPTIQPKPLRQNSSHSHGGGYYNPSGAGGPLRRRQFFPNHPNQHHEMARTQRHQWAPPKQRRNTATDMALKELSGEVPTLSFQIDPNQLVCFFGQSHRFTLQFEELVMIDDKLYESADHYYQMEKVRALCGATAIPNEMLDAVRSSQTGERADGKHLPYVKSTEFGRFGALARKACRRANVSHETQESWRYKDGLQVIQRALAARVAQSAALRSDLEATEDRLIVHSYRGDAIYGAGTDEQGVKRWAKTAAEVGTTMRIPSTFPITETASVYVPLCAEGRNLLGVILMLLRHRLKQNAVVIQDMTSTFAKVTGTHASQAGAAAKASANHQQLPDADMREDTTTMING